MDLALPPSTTTTTTTGTAAAVTARAVASAATTVVSVIGRGAPRNGTHRPVNVNGRLNMYDEIVINDVWINAILSTLAFTCAACLCVCFLYCKFQQWKLAAQLRRDEKNSRKFDNESLPSYTIVTGLPSYDEAVERMNNPPPPPPPPPPPSTAAAAAKSVTTTVQVYVKDERRRASRTPSTKPAAAAAATCCPSAAAAATATAAPADPAKKLGLVSHTLVPAHDGGCRNCLSVQELLETYDVR